MSTTTAWILLVVFAFASFISFIQINSAWADANNFNTGWLIIGIVTGLVAIGCLIKVAKEWGGGSQP